MSEFVCGHEISEVDVMLLHDSLDEPYPLRIGHSVRKRLRERTIAGEFHDPELLKLVGAEVRLKVIQARLRRRQHVVDVVVMPRYVIDLQIHTLVLVAPDLILAREIGMEIENARRSHVI